jgi:hypothetical protein
VRGGPARVGEHTREVLAEHGFGEAAIEHLVEIGAIGVDVSRAAGEGG